jgi:hypothetical protein
MRKRMQSRSLLVQQAQMRFHTIQPHPLNMLICEAGLQAAFQSLCTLKDPDYVRVVQFWLLVGGRQPRICITTDRRYDDSTASVQACCPQRCNAQLWTWHAEAGPGNRSDTSALLSGMPA